MKTLKYIATAWLLLQSLFLFTQGMDQTQLTIGVYVKSDTLSGIDDFQFKRLETRIINIISNSGVTSNIAASRIDPKGVDNYGEGITMETMARGVVCFPKLEVFSEQDLDLGLKKQKVVDASLTLSIQYIHEDIIFSTLQLQLQGSGNTGSQAINNIIRNLRSNDPRFARFVSQTRSKIINYYTNNCNAIIEQARQLDRLDQPIRALQILWPIPRELACYEEVKEMMVDIYRKYINKRCRELLFEADTYITANNYDEGLAKLRLIDPTSNCIEDARKKLEEIKKEIDESDEQFRNVAMALLMERQAARARQDDRIESEVARANAQLPMMQISVGAGDTNSGN